MIKWYVRMLLTAGLSILHYMANGKADTTLRVCEGRVANFPNDYETTSHNRLIYTFRNKSGHATRICDMETSEKKPIISADYKDRFRRTSLSGVGFALSNVSSSDEGNFTCLIFYSDGSEKNFAWTLRVEDSTKLNKPKIDFCDDKSRCVAYNCSHNETVEVDVYWKFAADKRLNGSHLFMCEKNRSELIICIIKSFCDVTHEYTILKEITHSRRKRSTSMDDYSSCSNADRATEEGTQTPSFGSSIGIGIVIGFFIGIAGTITVFYIRNRRKRNPKKDAAGQRLSNLEE